MTCKRTRIIAAWILLSVGFLATASPQLAQFFPLERTEPVLVDSLEHDTGIEETYEWALTTYYIAPWIPAVGGLLMLGGAVLLAWKSGTAPATGAERES